MLDHGWNAYSATAGASETRCINGILLICMARVDMHVAQRSYCQLWRVLDLCTAHHTLPVRRTAHDCHGLYVGPSQPVVMLPSGAHRCCTASCSRGWSTICPSWAWTWSAPKAASRWRSSTPALQPWTAPCRPCIRRASGEHTWPQMRRSLDADMLGCTSCRSHAARGTLCDYDLPVSVVERHGAAWCGVQYCCTRKHKCVVLLAKRQHTAGRPT